MQRFLFLLITFCAFTCSKAYSQQLTYSDISKDDSKRINFEILGKFNDNIIIYKNINRSHRLTLYDRDMHIIKNIKLDFISDKTFNVDFVSYPEYFYIVYQYQKGNTVYCKAAKMSSDGQLIGSVIDLDATKLNFFSDNKIYYLTNSEDKQKILLYKMLRKSNELTLETKLFNFNLLQIDSTRNVFNYNDRKETYDNLQVANDGTYLFAKETGSGRNDYTRQLQIFYHRPNTDSLISKEILLDDNFVEDVKIKIDNLNNQYIINSFSYKKNSGNTEGLFIAIVNKDNLSVTHKTIYEFGDDTRSKLSGRPDYRTAFNDFTIRNIVLRQDGGFIISAEEYYTQTRNNRWNSSDYYYNPYYYSPNYYSFQRGYYGYYNGYYSPFGNYYNNNQDITYNDNDVLVFSFDKNLQPEWASIINKKQSDLDTDNFLSYSTVNMGAEIHYIFLQKDNNRQIMSDHALQPNGEFIRYATIKSREVGYEFMPKLAKQIGARQIIIPCILRGNIAFAKIDFN